MARFQDFNFGFMDARTEYSESPRLLRDGHLAIADVDRKILEQQHFLVLGHKGCGKTMASARLQAMADDEPARYMVKQPIQVNDLLPLGVFDTVVPESVDPAKAAMVTWELFLLVKIIEQISADQSANPPSQKAVKEQVDALSKHNIILSIPRRPRFFQAKSLSASINILQWITTTLTGERGSRKQRPEVWIEVLAKVCANFESSRMHVLFVDGLDDAGPISDEREPLLAGLIQAATTLNNRLRSVRKPSIKVVICCRTDLYERLDIPNQGRLRGDYAVELDWYDAKLNEQSNLARLANLRARLDAPELGSLFQTYFPGQIGGQPTVRHLLLHTRHTPRDFLTLLTKIQKFADEDSNVRSTTVKEGITAYSREYFRREINDALDSYFTKSERDTVTSAMAKISTRVFSRQTFSDVIASTSGQNNIDPALALQALFECGLIGGDDNSSTASFRYSEGDPAVSAATFDSFEFHQGLLKG